MKGKRHKTVYQGAKRDFAWLEALPFVSKVIIGRTENCSHKYVEGTIRATADVPAGVKCKVYSTVGVTDVVVYCADDQKKALREKLTERFT